VRILIIQTAFLGDVILASPVWAELHRLFPDGKIDVMVRKGNENLVEHTPYINKVIIWNKQKGKYLNLLRLAFQLRKEKYDIVINLQRFAASGFLTWFSRGKERIGFDKNPFAFSYHKKINHQVGNGQHEVERNLSLIVHHGAFQRRRPELHFLPQHEEHVRSYKNRPYICLAPTSVWFTKQLPAKKWVELIRSYPNDKTIYLLGAPSDQKACEEILHEAGHPDAISLCGKLNLIESALLMRDAEMNFVNDSAPLHLASSMNAPVTAFFCSTIPEFGFGPLSDQSIIKQNEESLDCRPCGLHGYKECPKGHFKCGEISIY